jgi:hypothetical protein
MIFDEDGLVVVILRRLLIWIDGRTEEVFRVFATWKWLLRKEGYRSLIQLWLV